MRTQTVAVPMLGWWMFFQFPVGRKRACAVAKSNEFPTSAIHGAPTFVEVRVLRRTATVWSCAETSSIVFGRL
jgi:hypothetical protein